jgi:hypothetical protein
MQPGRELDVEIAQKVMGWERIQSGGMTWWELGTYRAHPDSLTNPLPHYSTEIATAWEVVNRVQLLKGCDFELNRLFWGSLTEWNARFGGISTGHGEGAYSLGTGMSRSAPHAICVAALKAVGVDKR